MGDAISIDGLVKSFGAFRALDHLDLQVAQGEVHGFLGPNGSGKSTTIRILLGLLRADAGRVRLLDGDPWRDAVRLNRRLAYVPGEVSLWPNLTGGEVIDMLGHMRGGLQRSTRDAMIERFSLDPTKHCRSYSKGNRQKVALVSALAADVELLVLDEPTSGLDPLMEVEFQRCIREAAAAGRTVLLSSHILAEVEALCDRVSILRDGRTVEHGTLAQLRRLTRTSVDALTVTCPQQIAERAGVHGATVEGNNIRMSVDSEQVTDILAELAQLGIVSIACHPPTLEELFLREYGDDRPPPDTSAEHDRVSQR